MKAKDLDKLLSYLEGKKKLIEETLEKYFPKPEALSERAISAAKYSLFSGGKRIRPILCLLGYELFQEGSERVLLFACGIECLHTYSLIHDDLPAMDDDDFRRGKPSCHKAFDEGTAILAGDGLQALAFYFFSHKELVKTVNSKRLLKAINLIADAVSFNGMVGGQMGDLLMEGKKGDKKVLKWIHERKTGRLFTASLVSGAILANAKRKDIKTLERVGRALGLAFQIVDDLLDLLGDEKKLGKPVKSDLKKKKLTYPALYGVEASQELARKEVEKAKSMLKLYGERAENLLLLSEFIYQRVN